jgi:hypothetical protein
MIKAQQGNPRLAAQGLIEMHRGEQTDGSLAAAVRTIKYQEHMIAWVRSHRKA